MRSLPLLVAASLLLLVAPATALPDVNAMRPQPLAIFHGSQGDQVQVDVLVGGAGLASAARTRVHGTLTLTARPTCESHCIQIFEQRALDFETEAVTRTWAELVGTFTWRMTAPCEDVAYDLVAVVDGREMTHHHEAQMCH